MAVSAGPLLSSFLLFWEDGAPWYRAPDLLLPVLCLIGLLFTLLLELRTR